MSMDVWKPSHVYLAKKKKFLDKALLCACEVCARVCDVLARGRDGARERDRECVNFAHDILDDFLLRVCV